MAKKKQLNFRTDSEIVMAVKTLAAAKKQTLGEFLTAVITPELERANVVGFIGKAQAADTSSSVLE